MGLSAFNRAREIRAQMNEQNEQEEQSRLEEQRQADVAAAASVHDMIVGIDLESPDFAKMVIGARTAHSALTPEQKEMVGSYAALEEAEIALLEKLAIPVPPAEPAPLAAAEDATPPPPAEPAPLATAEDATPPPPAEPVQGTEETVSPVETVPPAAEPEKSKKPGGSKK